MSKVKKAANKVAGAVDIAMNRQGDRARASAIQPPGMRSRKKRVTGTSKGVKRKGRA